jgi:hypothetical protein
MGSLGGQQAVFRGGVEVVSLDVSVRDGNRVVQGLTAGDFQVLDSGIPQEVDQVSLESFPIDVSLLLDVSHSIGDQSQSANRGWRMERAPGFEWMARGLSALTRALRPKDRLQVLSFAATPRTLPVKSGPLILSPPTNDRFAGRTAFLDVLTASLILPTEFGRRRLVIAFTDAKDTASVIGSQTRLAILERAEPVVHIVAVGSRDARVVRGHPDPDSAWLLAHGRYDVFLEDLAAETGGRFIAARSEQEVARGLQDAIGEFLSRYVLTYEPRGVNQSGWHGLDVSIKGKKHYEVAARRGYFRR